MASVDNRSNIAIFVSRHPGLTKPFRMTNPKRPNHTFSRFMP